MTATGDSAALSTATVSPASSATTNKKKVRRTKAKLPESEEEGEVVITKSRNRSKMVRRSKVLCFLSLAITLTRLLCVIQVALVGAGTHRRFCAVLCAASNLLV